MLSLQLLVLAVWRDIAAVIDLP